MSLKLFLCKICNFMLIEAIFSFIEITNPHWGFDDFNKYFLLNTYSS